MGAWSGSVFGNDDAAGFSFEFDGAKVDRGTNFIHRT